MWLSSRRSHTSTGQGPAGKLSSSWSPRCVLPREGKVVTGPGKPPAFTCSSCLAGVMCHQDLNQSALHICWPFPVSMGGFSLSRALGLYMGVLVKIRAQVWRREENKPDSREISRQLSLRGQVSFNSWGFHHQHSCWTEMPIICVLELSKGF